MWLDRFDKKSVVTGRKQTLRAILSGKAKEVIIAKDAPLDLQEEIKAACQAAMIPCETADSMRQLGAATGIQVEASACAVLHST